MKINTSLASVALLALAAAQAGAHSKSEKTTPADRATVTSADVIEIEFDDPMRVTVISVEGPDGEMPIERETGLDPVLQFRAVLPGGLPAGTYTVNWRGLASDGHPMQGTFGFRVAE